MFQEADFDEPAPSVDTSSVHTKAPKSAVHPTASAAKGGFVRFHKPGEEGFSAVAGAADDVAALYDTKSISGDAWLSNECHCIQCETLRVMTCFSALSHPGELAPVIVLMDLDNFGFNQFKSIPPYKDVELLDHVVVWAFFGSCFTRHHHTWPTTRSVCEPLPGRVSGSSRSSSQSSPTAEKKSIWEILVDRKQVFFTPCGGQSQAADNVMHGVMDALHGVDTIFLTGDVRLINEIYRSRRLLGMKSRRGNEEDITDRLNIINVTELDKRFVPVWRVLCQCLRMTQRECDTSSSDDGGAVHHR